MRESMYSALFGALSNEIRMDTIANNLANVNTTGFKKDAYSFQDTFQHFAHDYVTDTRLNLQDEQIWPKAYVEARTRLAKQYSDVSQGSLQETGNPLDVALSSPGFFRVRTPQGDFLTRDGSFRLNADGGLVTEQGYPVLGGGEPIVLPPGNVVHIDSRGVISSDGEQVAELDVVDVSDPKSLEKQGSNLFQLRSGSRATEIPVENPEVAQGYLEKSNVKIVSELLNMIEAQRAFETYQKVMSNTDSMESLAINKVGQVS